MAFRGIFPPAELIPTEFGLLSAARVMTHTARAADETWIRGFSFEYDTQPTLRLLEDGGSAAHTLFDGTGLARYLEVKPFFFEVEDFRSTFSLTGEDRFARVLRQIEAATQKVLEREFCDGHVARADANGNQYLAKYSTLTFPSATPSTAIDIREAISRLELALAGSPVGEQGTIHLTRDTPMIVGGDRMFMRVEDDKGKFHLETVNGTTTAIGSGYTGNGPVLAITTKALSGNTATITTSSAHYLSTGETVTVAGVGAPFDGTYTVSATGSATQFSYSKTNADITSAAATGTAQMQGTDTVKWIYATGFVDVHVGKAEVVNDNLAQGYGVTTNKNDMRIKATRPLAIHFDPSVHAAVKASLTL